MEKGEPPRFRCAGIGEPPRRALKPRASRLRKRCIMSFASILFEKPEDRPAEDQQPETSTFLVDLNLDQILAAVTQGRDEYDLLPLYLLPLGTTEAIEYRQGVMQDLEDATLLEAVKTLARRMRSVRGHLVQALDKLYYKYQKEAWFLDAVDRYCEAALDFTNALSKASLKSRGLLDLRAYLSAYVASESFKTLVSETQELKSDLAEVQYCVLIKGDRVTVRGYEDEPDYSAIVEKTFEKFKQGAVKDYLVHYSDRADMNHIEAQILDFVARLHPGVFSRLDDYCIRNADFRDDTLVTFDREVQFYAAFLDYIASLKAAGLKFCYPHVSALSKEVYDYEGFDLALAHKLVEEGSAVVTNDFHLKDPERILVVTGPNQGGKTTFARTFGQLHHLARLGLPVPGRKARLFLFDRLFTHFEREEDVKSLRGKLQDDLVRIHQILDCVTPKSIVVLNEIFTSTTLRDAIFLSRKVMESLTKLDLLGVWVTFVEEMASYGEQTVSMVSTIVPGNPALRTFKIVRKPADGLSYALSIAERYGLTYDALTERIPT